MIYFIIFIVFFIYVLLEEVNFEIKLNPYLFLLLRVNKKNQKKLYQVLKDKFENER